MDILQQVRQLTEQLFPEVVGHYRHLHSHPELSYREQETAAYITAFLQREGIPFRNGIGGYGIVAEVKGEKELLDDCIAFVADMDALPVQEENEVPYRSVNEGVMHACGHDAQAAALMGAVKMIHSLRRHFAGTLLFVFQPGEEQSPGGADLMLRDNLFGEQIPRMIIKQHAYIDLPAGHVAFQSGTVMASADEVHLTVKGQGAWRTAARAERHRAGGLADCGGHAAAGQSQEQSFSSYRALLRTLHCCRCHQRDTAGGDTRRFPALHERGRAAKMLVLIPKIASDTASAYGCQCETLLPEGLSLRG